MTELVTLATHPAAWLALVTLIARSALIVKGTAPVVSASAHRVPWCDLILIAGSPFLIREAAKQIHHDTGPDPIPGVFETPPESRFDAVSGHAAGTTGKTLAAH
jgi:hypothetical protein